jgi:hypothetical protein
MELRTPGAPWAVRAAVAGRAREVWVGVDCVGASHVVQSGGGAAGCWPQACTH